MQFQSPDESARPVPAVVAPVDASYRSEPLLPGGVRKQASAAGDLDPPQGWTPLQGAKNETLEQPPVGISNRPERATYRVVYVNGIRTSEEDARKAAMLVRTSLGVNHSECEVLYNPRESVAAAGAKILGGGISSRLGARSEPETVHALCRVLRESLRNSHDVVVLVGHSQGSLAIQNAFDRVYDEHQESPYLKRIWEERSKRIEVILYAPLVRTLAPGPQAVSLLNSCDLPARGIGALQRAISSSKHYLGYRPHQAIQTVIYSPGSNQLTELLASPLQVHESFQLILDNVDFNMRLLGENRKTKELDGELFATNLAQSILNGRRSDALHYELILKGCERFGAEFAVTFLSCTHSGGRPDARYIGNFVVHGKRLERVETTATRHTR